MKQHNPEKQIKLGNCWYTGDQFQAQLGIAGPRRVVENRWNIFQSMILEWMNKYENKKRCINLLDAGCGDGINLVGMHKILSVMPNNILFLVLIITPFVYSERFHTIVPLIFNRHLFITCLIKMKSLTLFSVIKFWNISPTS